VNKSSSAETGANDLRSVLDLTEAVERMPGGFMKIRLTTLAFMFAILAPLTAGAQQITGAGATFPAPLYFKWAEAAKPEIGVKLDYQAIGSSGGQNQILNRSVDFGASDAPTDPAMLDSGDLIQVPTVMGAVLVIVNIPGVGMNQLKLPDTVVADIYAGTVTKWNDQSIVTANPGVQLPSLVITPVYRADGSGTTLVWTTYLSAISPTWMRKVGAGTSVNWPVGARAVGNGGVAASVRNTPGAIGYVEGAYTVQNNLVTVQLRNKSGHYVSPSLEAYQAAASQADWLAVNDFAVSIINMPGDTSWPILSATFILLPKHPQDQAASANVVKFIEWAYKNGSAIATNLRYIPLPHAVQDAALAAMASQIEH
jgi:phosphate transport system substrate-binding protein